MFVELIQVILPPLIWGRIKKSLARKSIEVDKWQSPRTHIRLLAIVRWQPPPVSACMTRNQNFHNNYRNSDIILITKAIPPKFKATRIELCVSPAPVLEMLHLIGPFNLNSFWYTLPPPGSVWICRGSFRGNDKRRKSISVTMRSDEWPQWPPPSGWLRGRVKMDSFSR